MTTLARPALLFFSLFFGGGMWMVSREPARSIDARPVVPRAPIGKTIANFTLCDHRGKTYSLTDFADKTLVVIVFLGAECPLAHLYAGRLATLLAEYEPRGVGFIGINSNDQDSLGDLAAFVHTHRLRFPMLKDPDHAVADLLGALRTPEAFVLDGGRIVRYWGRIDDQYAVGVHGTEIRRRDLADALDDLLAQRPVRRSVVPSTGCLIGRVPRGTPTGDITYARHIQPLLERNCIPCHRAGEIAPFSLTTYDAVVAWSAMIREVVAEGRMPPWFADANFGHFRNDARLSSHDKKLLTTWIDNHCPEGEPTRDPAKRLSPGWRIPQPDQVLFMADKPHPIPAEGDVDYQYFLVDPGFTEDKYLKAAEVRPGNRAIVHHALVALVPPGDSQTRFDTLGALLDYAPGMQPMILPPGTALRIPAGSRFLFQLHYTPSGSVEQDRSYLGLVFADPRTVQHLIQGGAVLNQAIDIPPGTNDYRLQAEYTVPENVRLSSLSPHMHGRGKSFRVEAHYSDGRREILLDVPGYDFNWQLRYELAERKRLPAGTRLVCTAHYDNSSSNRANPDPTKAVRWGDQTHDEMMICFFAFVGEQ